MKAVYITAHGGIDSLQYGDLPEPTPGPNDFKVRVRACALNRLDVFTREGLRGTRLKLDGDRPHILGGDVAGDIVEVGAEVRMLRVGDRVVINPRTTCGQCSPCIAGETERCEASGRLGLDRDGGYAEYVCAPAVNAVKLPDTLSYEDAAALPTVYMPSWNILIRRADLKPWETALVLSASGGVGTAAIQVAKKVIGARVITTTSTDEKAQKALEIGADDVIVYTREKIQARVKELTRGRGVDVVLDHVGGEFWPPAVASLAVGGRYGVCGVTAGYTVELQMGLMFLRNQTIFGVFMGRQEDLRQIVQLAGRGDIRSIVHATFPLERTGDAHRMMEERGFFGKIVLTML